MKKKFLVILCLLGLLAALCACGAEPAEVVETPAEPAAEETAPEETVAEAPEVPAEEEATEEETPEDTVVSGPEMDISLITTLNANEPGGMCVQKFMDLVTEKTAGAVTFTPYFGGTMASTPEELEYIASGSVDMGLISVNAHGDMIPLANIPTWFSGTMEQAVDAYNYVMYENEETAALVAEECEAAGVKLLSSSISGGANAFFCTKEFASLADFSGLKAGVISNFSAYEALGMTPVMTFPPDAYENMSRGVSDFANMGMLASYSMRYYEVAPYFCFDGQYSVGTGMACNLDFWNNLPAEYQELFEQCMKEIKDYSLSVCEEQEDDAVAAMVAEGATQVTLSDEDVAVWFDYAYAANEETARNTAADAGVSEQMELMLTALSEKLAS